MRQRWWDPTDQGCGCGPRDRFHIERRPVRRGDTIAFQTQLYGLVLSTEGLGNPPSKPQEAPFNVTGCFIWWTGKPYTQNLDIQATWEVTTEPSSVPPGGLINVVSASAGIIQCFAPPLATQGFPDGIVAIQYDIQVQTPAGQIMTLEAGVIPIVPDITNAIAEP